MNKEKRWIPLTGVAFLVMAIAGLAVAGETPNPGDGSARQIVDFYVDNKDSVTLGVALTMVAATLLIFFAGHLRQVLRSAEGERGTLSLVAFAGAVVLAVAFAVDGTISYALAQTADDVDPTAVQALNALANNDYIPLGLGAAVLMLASGISIVRHGALSKWLGWSAIVIGALAPTPAGGVSVPGMAIWILVVSVVLSTRGAGAPAPSTRVSPTPAA